MEYEINYNELRELSEKCPFLLDGDVEEGDIALGKHPDAEIADLSDRIEFGEVPALIIEVYTFICVYMCVSQVLYYGKKKVLKTKDGKEHEDGEFGEVLLWAHDKTRKKPSRQQFACTLRTNLYTHTHTHKHTHTNTLKSSIVLHRSCQIAL